MTTTTLYSLTGDSARLARQIEEATAGLYSDDPQEVDAAVAALNALLDAQGQAQAELLAKANSWAWAVAALNVLLDAQEQTQAELLAKANSWAWVIHSAVARGEARAAQARRLQELARRDAAQAEQMKAALVAALQRVFPDQTSYQLADHRLASRASEAVETTCEPAELPQEYQRTKIEADKTLLKAALKAGQKIPGVELVQRRSWKLA